MARYLLILLVAFSSLETLKAQPLYTPRNIKEAYKKGTPSPDGPQGNNSRPNRGRYTITISAAPPDRTIRGTEKITYINNSPDTLKVIVIRLTANIHKAGAIRLNTEEPDYLTTGVTIDKYAENGTGKTWQTSDRVGTWKNVRLTRPLAPHDSAQLDFDWHYPISLKSNREGMIDSTTYFLAYFYPRVAVYDDYNGWDRINFMDSHEFYSDFNDYTVTVNVPKNYIVWGTGTLQQPEKLLQPAVLKRFSESMTSDEV